MIIVSTKIKFSVFRYDYNISNQETIQEPHKTPKSCMWLMSHGLATHICVKNIFKKEKKKVGTIIEIQQVSQNRK